MAWAQARFRWPSWRTDGSRDAAREREKEMIRAIIWKELREQGLIALTLVLLGGALLVAAWAFAVPPSPNAPPTDIIRFLGVGQLATLMLAVTAGMVCGGAVF